MKPIFFVIFFPALLSCGDGLCQNQGHKTAGKYFSKIVVEEGDSMFVETDTLLVDTLIMRNRAKLGFMFKCVLGISHAFIGNRCQFNAAGTDGANGNKLNRAGQPGGDGRDLRISIRFDVLGNLTILANGGKGGFGLEGQNSLNAYESGEDGARGGDGGRGGNVDLFYLSPKFMVVVHEQSKQKHYVEQKGDTIFYLEQRRHAVFFNVDGGLPGRGGKGGDLASPYTVSTPVGLLVGRSREATKGRQGASGSLGESGMIRFKKTR
jgi:hypothetical protein